MAKFRKKNHRGSTTVENVEFQKENDGKRLLPKTIVPEYNPTGPIPNVRPTPSSNNPPNSIQESQALSEKKSDINRANNQRRDDDTIKNMSIDLIDIDDAIISYMRDDIRPDISELGGNIINVPIIYGSAEMWVGVQKDGFLRDKKGKIQRPLIMIKRTGFSRNDSLITFNRYLSFPWIKNYSSKNQYDNFNVLTSNIKSPLKPVKEIYDVTLPDHINVTYQCIIWTDYIEHLNKIEEKINFAAQDYWGDPKRFKFRARIDNFSEEVEVSNGDERIVRSTFNIEVNAYLLPQTFEDKKATMIKSLTPRKVVFDTEKCLRPDCNG